VQKLLYLKEGQLHPCLSQWLNLSLSQLLNLSHSQWLNLSHSQWLNLSRSQWLNLLPVMVSATMVLMELVHHPLVKEDQREENGAIEVAVTA
jgi:hypothetical protein